VTSSVDFLGQGLDVSQTTGCAHLGSIVEEVADCVSAQECQQASKLPKQDKAGFVDEVVARNVLHTAEQIVGRSEAIARVVGEGKVKVVGAVYDVSTGEVRFFDPESEVLAAKAG
jgi:carbonic anhydrase/SulP family sulfate permease